MIRARGLTIAIGEKRLVDDVDLEVDNGELVAIVGPNGAGKSTLLGALAGDRRLRSGSVHLDDRDAHAATPAILAHLRAVLPQRSSLSLAFTATEVVCLAHRTITPARARAHLEEVELGAFVDREYPSLSGGEQQRVQLARVLAQLACSPGAALLLDEPTSALDPRHQRLVMSLARAAASRGHAVVAVLHDLTLAASADRVALLARGELVALGAPRAVLVAETLEAAYATRFEILEGRSGVVVATETHGL